MDNLRDPRRIFISYEVQTGLPLASSVRTALEGLGISGWVWEIDHPSGYVFSEIAERIREADYICWICTAGTPNSGGQKWEIENALGQDKLEQFWVIADTREHVPLSLRGYYAHEGDLDKITAVVQDWVKRCRRGFPGWPSLSQQPTVQAENAPLSAPPIKDEAYE